MGWKFWRKKPDISAHSQKEAVKPTPKEKPRDLPQLVYRHLVVDQGYDPDWVWKLKCIRQRRANPPSTFDIRIFDPEETKQEGVTVKDYAALDHYSQLVIFAGWYDKELSVVELEKMIDKAV